MVYRMIKLMVVETSKSLIIEFKVKQVKEEVASRISLKYKTSLLECIDF